MRPMEARVLLEAECDCGGRLNVAKVGAVVSADGDRKVFVLSFSFVLRASSSGTFTLARTQFSPFRLVIFVVIC